MDMLSTLTAKLLETRSSLGRLPINMYFVFLTFKVSLFTFSHVWIVSKSEFIITCKVSGSSAADVKVVSSAYILGFEYTPHEGRSFMYEINNSGPRIDPWGILQVNIQKSESSPPTKVFCFRPVRYDLNQANVWDLTP